MDQGEPFFDVVELPFPRDDAWAWFLSLFGIHLIVKIPQIVFRPGGQERMRSVFSQLGK